MRNRNLYFIYFILIIGLLCNFVIIVSQRAVDGASRNCIRCSASRIGNLIKRANLAPFVPRASDRLRHAHFYLSSRLYYYSHCSPPIPLIIQGPAATSNIPPAGTNQSLHCTRPCGRLMHNACVTSTQMHEYRYLLQVPVICPTRNSTPCVCIRATLVVPVI